ncbi:CBS domain-containing protein [Thiomonas sp.]|jgi:signal-transduction protein with cAMP-binding, CBS, and nucleotidyltransferase domain|uniref:CBS domain-containing protein n=1 Tax=Thiomonas sp. TaxID=2047785 RepID=UPI00345D59A8
MNMQVHEIFTRGAVHIPQERNLQEAAQQMLHQHVGALIVTDGGADNRLLGIVTDRDIVLKSVAAGSAPRTTLVAEVMSTGVASVGENDDLMEAMQAMFTHGVRRLAVTGADGAVVGVVSLDDVIEAMVRDWVLLASIVRGGQQRERSGSVQSALHP